MFAQEYCIYLLNPNTQTFNIVH